MKSSICRRRYQKSNVFYFDVCRYWPVIPVVDPNGFYTVESKIYQLTEGGRYKSQKDDGTPAKLSSWNPSKTGKLT